MANPNSWLEHVILVAGYSLVLSLGYLGYNSVISTVNEIKCVAEKRSEAIDKKLEVAVIRDEEHKLAITELRIYMTMNYEQRVKTLEQLNKQHK